MKKFLILIILITTSISVTSLIPKVVFAEDPFSRVCDRTNPNPDSTVCSTPIDKDPIKGADSLVSKISNFIAALGGLIAVIMIIYNGLQLIISTGDATKVTQARNGIIYAAVGIVVLVMARTIVYFVQSKL